MVCYIFISLYMSKILCTDKDCLRKPSYNSHCLNFAPVIYTHIWHIISHYNKTFRRLVKDQRNSTEAESLSCKNTSVSCLHRTVLATLPLIFVLCPTQSVPSSAEEPSTDKHQTWDSLGAGEIQQWVGHLPSTRPTWIWSLASHKVPRAKWKWFLSRRTRGKPRASLGADPLPTKRQTTTTTTPGAFICKIRFPALWVITPALSFDVCDLKPYKLFLVATPDMH